MHASLVLYAEHEFNASTFAARVVAGTGSDIYSAIAGGIGALRGPKHGGANEVALEIQARYATPDEAEADIRARVGAKEVVIGFGHPVYTVSDPRNGVIKEIARELSTASGSRHRFAVAERIEAVMADAKRMFANLDWFSRRVLRADGRADGDVHAAVRNRAHRRLGGARDRAARGRQDHPADRQLHRAREPALRAAGAAALTMPYLTAADLPAEPAGVRFRRLLERPEILQIPGTHNGQAALQARAAGFEACYLSGAAMTASMGLPDLGIITVDEVAFFIRQVARASMLPVLVDGDTGYGEALNAMHMVRAFEEAGAGAVHLEDQLLPKKCGHLNDKRLADARRHGRQGRRRRPGAPPPGRDRPHRCRRLGGHRGRGGAGSALRGGRRRRDLPRGADHGRRCSASSRRACPAWRCWPT